MEMQGFKSFPDALRVDFHEGVTAIVGPNGSGKSNISDAIRWVLGEQSTKTLRGSKMEDVIFAGTEERRRMGFAEVTLTLDNSGHALKTDYDEVAVTRRYYRSGESEYYINKKAVRLRDIHELFMDTGIGRDGYSVIGQGRIDEILSVRAQDRREIFDEAAGITKYRYRRDEAERKLVSAEDNLTRVTDLVAEMETQLPGLEKQAEKERTYNALREEQKKLEVALWLRQLDAADGELTRAQADFDTAAEGLEACAAETRAIEEAAAALTERMRALEEEQEHTRLELQDCTAGRASEEGKIALSRAALERNREEAARGETERAARAEKMEELRGRVRALGEEILVREAALRAAEETLVARTAAEERAGARMQAAQAAREENRTAADALRARESDARARVSSAQAAASELQARIDALHSADRTREEARLEAEEKLEVCLRAEAEAREALTSKENVLAGYARMQASRTAREKEAREAHTQCSIRLADTENRLRLLSELARDYEGYAKAVRAVMQRRESLGGIHGPVSALIGTDDAHVAAIETALGAAAGNIVVDTEQDARRAIGMLKSRDEGRATFLPLSVVRGTELDPREYGRLPGVVGLASRLVRCDPVYAPVMRNLLGRTVVIDTIDSAIAAARQSGHRLKLVTLDGQVLLPGGAMTGGSLARSSGVLTRANELARLKAARERVTEELSRAAREVEEASRESAALGVRTEAAREELEAAKTALTACTMASDRAKMTLEGLCRSGDEEKELLEQRLAEVTGAWERAEAERGIVQERLRENAALDAQLEGELSRASAEKQTASAAKEDARRASEDAKGAVREARASEESARRHLAEAEEEERRRGETARDFDAENRALEAQLREAEERCGALSARMKEAQETLSAILARKQEIEAQRVAGERKSRDAGQRQIALERERVRLENRLENVKKSQDSLAAALWDEYGLTRATARECAVPLEDPDAAKKRADALRREIRALGSVYTGAIEEYTKLRGRYDFYKAQQDDARESKTKLEGVIAELNRQMRRQFTEQFAVINRAFGETFAEVFGGGAASLELEDESDVLSCGIEIRVQIPGKTLKSLSLLSGGERAFVAIALYFAILRVRPTPFCILDEIDAALDDVNVGRFARYLRRYADRTQFIVITHRRHTMEEADMLYGVAMPVQGVSKLLAFDVGEAAREFGIKN
ncbi:MAG: chromosome segregation protein SMC [Clostridiaceae bacterium]|nr:chromosome segregation protein SMC [Clostridiaceae bacterium]